MSEDVSPYETGWAPAPRRRSMLWPVLGAIGLASAAAWLWAMARQGEVDARSRDRLAPRTPQTTTPSAADIKVG